MGIIVREYGIGWSRALDEYMLRDEASGIMDKCISILTTFSIGEAEKAGAIDRDDDPYNLADLLYNFKRRKLEIQFKPYCDGPNELIIYYDNKQVLYVDEDSGVEGDIHAQDAMTVLVEDGAYFEGEWVGNPAWLRQIGSLYKFACIIQDKGKRMIMRNS